MAKRPPKKPVRSSRSNAESVDQKSGGPYLLPGVHDWEPSRKLKIRQTDNPATLTSLGHIGIATEVGGGDRGFPPTILIQPFDRKNIIGIDPVSIRVFRWYDDEGLLPVWNSGVNVSAGYVWAKIQRPGIYVPIGLPRDKVLQSMIQVLAVQRKYLDVESAEQVRSLTDSSFELFLKAPEADLELLRALLANFEVQSSFRPVPPYDLAMGNGGHIQGFQLPGGASLQQLKKRLTGLKIPQAGLPEEALFFRPELGGEGVPFLLGPPDPMPIPGFNPFVRGGFPGLGIGPMGWEPGDDICPPLPIGWPRPFWPFPIDWPRFPKPRWPLPLPFPFCKLFSRNWPTYHHDR